jgi:asparagine synthase (glutamine-hydrolysing)
MCGISVLLQRPGANGGAACLARLHQPIRHRGPDGEGFLVLGRGGRVDRSETPSGANDVLVGMAFRRLKILDLSSAGDQPMASPDGSCWIVFNGEIYNYRALRSELRALGREFRTSGDTEVVLAAYEQWGEGCFHRFEGMWAIVALDLKRRRLVGSRDRFGIKPLYWSLDDRRLLLASEIKQILNARASRPRACAPVVRAFLQGNRYPILEETFFEGIRSVPPATWFELSLEGDALAAPRFQPYWSLAETWCEDPGRWSYPEAVARFDERLTEAVRSHSVADVTVGSLLSGGLDSSTIAQMLASDARAEGRDAPTFSFGFRGRSVPFCELRYVEALTKPERLVNHDTSLDATWVRENAGRVVRTLEEPPLGLPALAQFRVFELCRAHDTTVVLDGEASDEVLAGYPYHQRLLLADRLRRGRYAEFARELLAIARRDDRGAAAVLGDYFVAPLARRLAREPRWIPREYGVRASPSELQAAREDRSRDASLLNRRLYFDVRWGNVKLVLSYTDKSSMAHSVEARVPFLDRALVELAFSLPDSYKTGAGERKRILRDVARRRLPAEITERRDRMGFATPDEEILRGGLWPVVRESMSNGFLASPCFERPVLERFLRDFEAGRNRDVRRAWRLYALAGWKDAFDVSLS